jgi:hypothetical protein
MTSPSTPATTARDHLQALTVVGAVLALVGGTLAGLTWPHDTVSAFGSVQHHGSGVGLAIGAALAWVGQAFLFVGLVGWGVKLGRQASPDRIAQPLDVSGRPDVPS